MYRVMLHNDSSNRQVLLLNQGLSVLSKLLAIASASQLIAHRVKLCRREYVVRVLMKVVDGLTVDDAVNVMQVRLHLALLRIVI